MLTVQYATATAGTADQHGRPGYTATDFNGHRGDQTVEQGAEIIVRLAQIGPDGPTGEYLSLTGTVPW